MLGLPEILTFVAQTDPSIIVPKPHHITKYQETTIKYQLPYVTGTTLHVA